MIQDNFKRTVLKIKYKNMSLNLLVILLLSSFFMPFFRVEAYAISPYTPGTLGICTIANPTYDPSNSNDSPHPSEYNRVYFGWIPENPKARVYNDPFNGPSDPELINPYGDLSNIPLYWRVLNTQSNDCREYKKEALFMLMEYSLPNGISWDNRSSSRQRWSIEVEENNDNNDDDYNTIMSTESENGEKTDSSIRLFLQGSSCNASYDGINPGQVDPDDPTKVLPGKYGFYDDCFSSAEQRAILSTQNNERDNWYNSGLSPEFDKADMPNFHTSKDGNNFRIVGDTSDASTACAYGCGLKGDTIFLLSAKEILNKEYGFDNSYGQEILSNDEYIYATIFDTNRIVRNLSYSSGSNNLWWLRSASFSSSGIAMVFNGALSVNSSISSDCHVRCALNIPLHSILMVSDASSEGMSPSITGNNIVAQFSPINTTSQFINNSPNPLYLKRTKFTYGTSEFSTQPLPESDPVVISPNPTVSPTPGFYGYGDGAKLTIVDDSMQFSLTNPSPNSTVNVYSGNKITISYSGAKNTYGTEN
ncbi:MAG: hypothetical protein J6Y29_00055, partial [Clostridiales bacterium]|nr:hypothetical protein [Clostridiales bacterium]